MRNRARAAGLLLVGVLLMGSCPMLGAAALDFPVREQSARPQEGDATVAFDFAFVNRGNVPITIRKVLTPCHCTTVELAKQTFAPGEGGSVPVVFTIGTASGQQRKFIRLFTSDAEVPVTSLTITIELPPGPVIEPAMVHWDLHAGPAAQTVIVQVPAAVPWRITRVVESAGRFAIDWKPEADGGRCELLVTPLQTTQAVSAAIVLETDTHAKFYVFAQVGPAPGPAIGAEPAQP